MRVLVTGANGHIGNNLVTALKGAGYEVFASVRALDDPRNTALAADSAINLVELDIRDGERFRRLCEEIDILFHLAATDAYVAEGRANERDMIADSVLGAENAINAAARQVRHVVLTSSIVTLPLTRPGEPAATVEDWQQDMSVPYFRAKTMAEKRAWELAASKNVRLTTILPGSIGGPRLLRRTPTTDVIEAVMLGGQRFGALRLPLPYVDVRDVVSAHMLAAGSTAGGRFVIVNDTVPTMCEIGRMMHAIDPTVPLPRWSLPEFVLGAVPFVERISRRLTGAPQTLTPEVVGSLRGRKFSATNQRARTELGWSPRVPIETSLRDTMEALRALRASEKS